MFPKISDLINYLLGTDIVLPIQTYGFMVAMAFLIASYVLYLELKRKEKLGIFKAYERTVVVGKAPTIQDLIVPFFIAFFVGFKLWEVFVDYNSFANNPQEFLFSWKGSWPVGLLFGVASAGWTYYSKNKEKLEKPKDEKVFVHPKELAGSILIVAAIWGLIGAKVFDVIEHLDDFFADPIGTFFSFSGLAFYGGMIGGTIGVAIYLKKRKMSLPETADCVAPALMLAYGIGRIGCQLSGDGCWGMPNLEPQPEWLSFLPNWMWAFDYPHNVINEGVLLHNCSGSHCHVLGQAVWPTPFYETTMSIILFSILWAIRKKIKTPLILSSIYLMMNGTERFIIEKIRVNIKYDFLGMDVTQAEIISTSIFLSGVILLTIVLLRKKKLKEV